MTSLGAEIDRKLALIKDPERRAYLKEHFLGTPERENEFYQRWKAWNGLAEFRDGTWKKPPRLTKAYIRSQQKPCRFCGKLLVTLNLLGELIPTEPPICNSCKKTNNTNRPMPKKPVVAQEKDLELEFKADP